jgi:DNA polymerase-3 subunit delta
MNSPTPVVYVYYGQDEPTLKEHLSDFCARQLDPSIAALNMAQLDGNTMEWSELELAAKTSPFLADVRLVLVNNLTNFPNGRALLDRLPDLITSLPNWSRLLFVEMGLRDEAPDDSPAEQKRKAVRLQALKKLINIVEADPRGKVLLFDLPRGQISDWLRRRAERHGAAIEERAARLLAERIHDDLVMADVELAKLATYVGGQRAITAEDVALLTPYEPEARIFDMVDALGQRKGHLALGLLRQLIEGGYDPLYIFGMIVRQYRLLIQMREHLDEGGGLASAAQTLGVRDFVARKMGEQARLYKLDQLERIYRLLLNTDREIKTGKKEPVLALEWLVTRLTAPRQK